MRKLEVFVRAVFRQPAVSQRFLGFFFELLAGCFARVFTRFVACSVFLLGALAAAQMFVEVGFAGAQGCKHIAFFGLVHHDVGHDAFGLDGFARGRVITRRGDLQAGIWPEWAHGLYRALAEGLVAHDDAAFVVLQRARHNLAGRGRAFVDQHHQRHVFKCAFGGFGHAFDRVCAAAALVKLGRGFVDEFAFGQLPVGGDHSHVLGQEGG